jgi:hypothetical protein
MYYTFEKIIFKQRGKRLPAVELVFKSTGMVYPQGRYFQKRGISCKAR